MTAHEGARKPAGYVIRPGEGQRIPIPGVPEETTVKAGAADTDGRLSVHEEWHAADDPGVPRHFHRYLDEMFYVLEGDMRFLLGEQEIVATPGTFLYIPRETVHAWQPVGTGPVRQLLVVVPGGFEGYLEEMGSLPAPSEDPEAWKALNRKWDVQIVGPVLGAD